MLRQLSILLPTLTLGIFFPSVSLASEPTPLDDSVTVAPALVLKSDLSKDQDDMCIWAHPTDPGLSTIITADKSAGRLFVYDLEGSTIQTIEMPEPGNIDLRNNVNLSSGIASVVAVNQRDVPLQLRVFRIDPRSRQLICIDNGGILTDSNYGGCLYQSSASGQLYFISTTKDSGVQQYQLYEDESGRIGGRLVRSWSLGQSEGAVADDKAGVLYIGEEERGVWKLGAEPDASTPGELVMRVGDSGLRGDVEGLALLSTGEKRYLLLSDQKSSRFLILDRDAGYRIIGRFGCEGAESTDGIDVISQSLGSHFSHGLFCCHTDLNDRPTLVVRLEDVLAKFESATGSR